MNYRMHHILNILQYFLYIPFKINGKQFLLHLYCSIITKYIQCYKNTKQCDE